MKKRGISFYLILSGILILLVYLTLVSYSHINDIQIGLSALCPVGKVTYVIGTGISCEHAKLTALGSCSDSSGFLNCPPSCPTLQSSTAGAVVDSYNTGDSCRVIVECHYACDYFSIN